MQTGETREPFRSPQRSFFGEAHEKRTPGTTPPKARCAMRSGLHGCPHLGVRSPQTEESGRDTCESSRAGKAGRSVRRLFQVWHWPEQAGLFTIEAPRKRNQVQTGPATEPTAQPQPPPIPHPSYTAKLPATDPTLNGRDHELDALEHAWNSAATSSKSSPLEARARPPS